VSGGATASPLAAPGRIGPFEARNRIVMSPMGTHSATGMPGPADLAYFGARAAGGAGIIVTGGTVVHQSATAVPKRSFEPFVDAGVDAFAALASAVHAEGALLIGQLFHPGGERLGFHDEWPTISPSGARNAASQTPHVLSVEEIGDVRAAFLRAARNLVAAGYDGIELHGAHGYLLGQFLSPATNRRQDRYGAATMADRCRLIVEVASALRQEHGPRIALGVRLSAIEARPGGLDAALSARIAGHLAGTGLLDYLSVTLGSPGSYVRDFRSPARPAADASAAIRSAAKLPVIAAQRIVRPADAEAMLREGAADFVALGRGLLADPQWPRKALSGAADDIAICIACMQDCRSSPRGPSCLNNPVTGEEHMPVPVVVRPRRVLVVGGGPAGLEAAAVAAERGHDVVLHEAAAECGGQVLLTAKLPGRADFAELVRARLRRCLRLGVEIRTGAPLDSAALSAADADVVIVATGAVPDLQAPEIDGVSTWDYLRSPIDVSGRDVLVIDDGTGSAETYGTAELLAANGARVTVISPAGAFAGLPAESRAGTAVAFGQLGASVIAHAAWEARPDDCPGVVVMQAWGRPELRGRALDADLVVVNRGRVPRPVLPMATRFGHFSALAPHAGLIHVIGDALMPRGLSEAIRDGRRSALQVGAEAYSPIRGQSGVPDAG
jgi:2,4-dienoyl-CoA reductase (NADPH2)